MAKLEKEFNPSASPDPVYMHTPVGTVNEWSVQVLPSGLLKIQPAKADPKIYFDISERQIPVDQRPTLIKSDGYDVTINPRSIVRIMPLYDASYCRKYVAPEAGCEKIEKSLAADWEGLKSENIKRNNDFNTPVIIISMVSGENYLVPATSVGMDKALSIANQILNGTYKPEAENAVSLQKRRALSQRQRTGGITPSP